MIKKLPISTNNLQDIATHITDKYSNQTAPTMSTSVSTPPPLTQHSILETKQIPEPSSSDFVVSAQTEAKLENKEAHRLNNLTTHQLDNRVLVDKLQSNSITQMDKPRYQELAEDATGLPNPKVEEVHARQDTINSSIIAIKSEQEILTKAPIVQETQTRQNNPSMSRNISNNVKIEIQREKNVKACRNK